MTTLTNQVAQEISLLDLIAQGLRRITMQQSRLQFEAAELVSVAKESVSKKKYEDWAAQIEIGTKALNEIEKIGKHLSHLEAGLSTVVPKVLQSLTSYKNAEALEEIENLIVEKNVVMTTSYVEAIKAKHSKARTLRKEQETELAEDAHLETAADGKRDLIIELKDEEVISKLEQFQKSADFITKGAAIKHSIEVTEEVQTFSNDMGWNPIRTALDARELFNNVKEILNSNTKVQQQVEQIITAPTEVRSRNSEVGTVNTNSEFRSRSVPSVIPNSEKQSAAAPLQNPKSPQEMSLEVFYQTHKNCMNVRALVSTKVENVPEKLMEVYKILKGTVVTAVSDPITTVGNPIKRVMVRVAKDQPLLQIPMSWLMVYA